MKYKVRVFNILMLGSIVLLIGIIIAYYNTASFGYDNANIISIYNDRVKIFDLDITYEFMRKIKDLALELLKPKVC